MKKAAHCLVVILIAGSMAMMSRKPRVPVFHKQQAVIKIIDTAETADYPFEDVRRITGYGFEDVCQTVGIDVNVFRELAVTYEINGTYALAVMILETSWGSSGLWVRWNNPAGITCGSSYCHYQTRAAGLNEMFALMAYYTYDLDLTTVRQQRERWSESDDWETIIRIMHRIERIEE